MTSYRRIQEKDKQGNQKEVGKGKKPPQYNRRMAEKSSQTRQELEVE